MGLFLKSRGTWLLAWIQLLPDATRDPALSIFHLIILILLAFVLVGAVGSLMEPIFKAGRRKREKLPMTAIFFF